MRKLILSAAAIVALSLSAIAGTPETKGEAKPNSETSVAASVEAKDNQTSTNLYWYSFDGNTSYGYGPEPVGSSCNAPGIGCAKGYLEEPADPTTDPNVEEHRSQQ